MVFASSSRDPSCTRLVVLSGVLLLGFDKLNLGFAVDCFWLAFRKDFEDF